MVTDGIGHGRPVMFAFTKRERASDIIYILQRFKAFMGDTSGTKTFVMDCSPAEMKAVNAVFPECRIWLCSFHVCRAFAKKVKSLHGCDVYFPD